MNGDTEMPIVSFGEGCTYDMLDTMLNGQEGEKYGFAVRVWMRQEAILTCLWGTTTAAERGDRDETSLLCWSEKDRRYAKEIRVATDDVRRIEIL